MMTKFTFLVKCKSIKNIKENDKEVASRYFLGLIAHDLAKMMSRPLRRWIKIPSSIPSPSPHSLRSGLFFGVVSSGRFLKLPLHA